MGLLDEAIREHLELKRRRGADPSAVAREVREALADTPANEPVDPALEAHKGEPDPQHFATSPGDDGWARDLDEVDPPPVATAHAEDRLREDDLLVDDVAPAAQQTEELDMQTIMEEDPGVAGSASPVGPISEPAAPGRYAAEADDDEAFGWETPNDPNGGPLPLQEIPGQERMSFE